MAQSIEDRIRDIRFSLTHIADQKSWGDVESIIEALERFQVEVSQDLSELDVARNALRKIARLNHRLQNLLEDEGLMHGEGLGILCDYILTADPWHPEPEERKGNEGGI